MGFLDNFTTTTNSDNRRYELQWPEVNKMTIGSTAVHVFNLPFVYSDYVKYCEVIYKQGVNIILVKKDFVIQEENTLNGNSILRVTLSPEETGKFKYLSGDTFVQIKLININNEISYSDPTEIKLISALDNDYENNRGYLYKNYITDYLYEIEFDKLDYSFAYDYFKENSPVARSSCTSIRWDGYFGRNQDCYYSDKVSFIVRTPAAYGRFATIGIADQLNYFDINTADSDTDLYKIIPFCIADGINEKGLCMSINAVPSLSNKRTKTTSSKFNDVAGTMLIRYCLDRFESVAQLKTELPKHTSIFNLLDGLEMHWLVADETETTILEIIDNKIKFVAPIAPKKAIITNFHLNDVILNPDHKVYSPIDVLSGHTPTQDNNIEKYGKGLERHNTIVSYFNQINGAISEVDMRLVLNKTFYTRAYPTSYEPATPAWYSEFVRDKLTIDSAPNEFSQMLDQAGKDFEARERGDNKTLFTSHSIIYDIKNKNFALVCQEDGDKEYLFQLK